MKSKKIKPVKCVWEATGLGASEDVLLGGGLIGRKRWVHCGQAPGGFTFPRLLPFLSLLPVTSPELSLHPSCPEQLSSALLSAWGSKQTFPSL